MATTSASAPKSARPDRSPRLWAGRALWTLVVVLLIACFAWLVAQPFWHPRTHLVLLASAVTGEGASPAAPSADYVIEDLREFFSLTKSLHRSLGREAAPLIVGGLASPGEIEQFTASLNDRSTTTSDVLVIYAAVQGASQDGDAWILTSAALGGSEEGGRYRLSALLASLTASSAATNLLLLDAGRLDYDPPRGLVDNDFSSRLVDQVEQLGNASVWVLVSHSAGQRSHLSPALRRSVFGYFVATGLAGAADVSGDQSIDLSELNQFVTSGVSEWVRQTTGGAAQQSPQLIWGRGQPLPRSLPALVAAVADDPARPRQVDHAKSIEVARQAPSADNRVVSEGKHELDLLIASNLSRVTPQGHLGSYVGDAARRAIAKVTNAAPTLPGAAAPTATDSVKSDAQAPAAATAKAPAAKADAPAEKPAPTDSKQDKPATGSSASAKASSSKADQPATPPAPTKEQLAEQLTRAWIRRDELAATSRQQVRPLDYAPHLWRDLEERLVALDQRLRTGFILETAELAAPLNEINQTLDWLAQNQAATPPPESPLARRFETARSGQLWTTWKPRSLALAELIAKEGGPLVPAELAPLATGLSHVASAGNRTDLEKLAQALKPEHDAWIELRLVRRLAFQPDLDWRLVQLLLATTHTGEQAAAASQVAANWQREAVEKADAMRLSAERQILAPGALDRDGLVTALTTSLEDCRAALANLATIKTAERLAHDLWRRLPQYLAWHASANHSPAVGPATDDLVALIARLDELESLLDRPTAQNLPAVQQAVARVAATKANVEKLLDPLAIEQLLIAPIAPGDAWRIELVLATALPTAEMRLALVAALPEIDAALGSQVQPAAAPTNASDAKQLRADFDRFALRAGLEHKLWQAALRGVANPELDALTGAWQLWNGSASSVSKTAGQSSSLEFRRERFEAALADLHIALPARLARGVARERDLSDPASRGARLTRLRGWERALRLLDPRLVAQIEGQTPVAALDGATAYDFLSWQARRAERSSEDAPPLDASYLRDSAALYTAAAASIPFQPPVGTGVASPLELTGPHQLELTYEEQEQADFLVRNTTSAALDVWIVAEYDPEHLSLTGAGNQTIHEWSHWQTATLEGASSGEARPPSTRGRPSFQLAPGASATIPLLVQRKKPSIAPSPFILRLITDRGLSRHDCLVELPRPEDLHLTVAGPAARWSPAPTGALLFPFPNRTTSFALQLASGEAKERKVDIEVYPVLALPARGLPTVPLETADAARLRSELSLGKLLAEARGLALPASGATVPVLLVAPEAATAPPVAKGSPTEKGGAADKAAPPPPASDKPPPMPLTSGIVVAITDLADKRSTFKHLDLAVQRPERYVRPQVRYRAATERIEIKVAPQDPALLPEDGVRIHGELAGELAADAVRQLDAVLKPALGDAEMHVEVPSAAGGTVMLQLTVDDYPRAIYYRVPTSGESIDVPEDTDLLAVRIVELPEGTIYQPPKSTIPVKLQIDAPASSLKNPPLRVEVGLDRNRDRELRGDELLVLTSDRHVDAALVGISKVGELEIETKVGDFTVEVPAAAVTSGRANVLAHAILGDKEAWSEPIEIVIDGQPPRVSSVQLRTGGTAVIGGDVVVSALADDLGLSGVARLEAMFDRDRSGKFGPMATPVLGSLADDGRWTAKVPTAGLASGSQSVIVRAIDRAGNASQAVRASVRLLTEDEAKADTKAKNSADITGVVMYGDQPQAGMQVTLALDTGAPPPAKGDKKKKKGQDEKATPPLATTTTDAQGAFKFPKVAPGKYVVSAEGLVKNNIRTAQQAVAFEKPADLQPLSLKLK